MVDQIAVSEVQRVGVVIPYFRAARALQFTMAALRSQGVPDDHVFIRDNSVDNVLFTAAANEGFERWLAAGRHEFALLLNHDAVLAPGSLGAMIRVMDANPRAGLCAPVSLDRLGAVKWCGGSDALPWGRHFTTQRERLPKAPYETLWANGACMLIRLSALRAVGLFDPTMRFVFSDVDFSFRLRLRDWTVVVCPQAFIEHELAGSSSSAPSWLQIIKLEDQIRFAEKWGLSEHYPRLAREAERMPPERVRELCNAAKRQIEELKLTIR